MLIFAFVLLPQDWTCAKRTPFVSWSEWVPLRKLFDENVCFSVETNVAEVDTIWDVSQP